MFRCPVCRLPLPEIAGEGRYACAGGHSFDVAREGYVNLLITHQRRARPPGDSREMVAARRVFLDAGHFEPLAQALDAAVEHGGERVLDAGCGEGHYSRRWPRLGKQVWAIDIAKVAVQYAARRAAGVRYAVASAYDLPVLDGAASTVVSAFAPLVASEFGRVLEPGGRLITATPGPGHLAALKSHLFAEPEPASEAGPLEAGRSGFVEVERQRVRFPIHLADGQAAAGLLAMTPWWWYVDAGTKARVAALAGLDDEGDVVVTMYRLDHGE